MDTNVLRSPVVNFSFEISRPEAVSLLAHPASCVLCHSPAWMFNLGLDLRCRLPDEWLPLDHGGTQGQSFGRTGERMEMVV